MQGQWIGKYQGSNSGTAVVDLDDFGDHLEGNAYVFDDDPKLPGTLAFVRTVDQSPKQTLELRLTPLHPFTGDILPREQLPEIAPGVFHPETATATFEIKGNTLIVSWTTSVGTTGVAALAKSRSAEPSDYAPEDSVKSWDQFKAHASSIEPERFVFRGQGTTHRLRTAFHRSKRKDLIRFMNQDIPTLHQILSARTKHLFNLNDPQHNAAFYNLVQHHGYPTPLLDWTRSPFVAAYFAFRTDRVPRDANDETVRVFMFDSTAWRNDFNQILKVTFARPHFSLLHALAIENDRAIPQQALSSVTNLDDIESYIRQREAENQKRYLRVFDIPRAEREAVLRDLRMMGITAGSMFPGFDGACEEIRTRLFGNDRVAVA
ncbi:MAG: FRG domain-containing protein [Bauldia sp.]